jgi:hypothetical protein
MRLRPIHAVLAAGLALAGLRPAAAQTTHPPFVDVYEYFTTDAQYEAWFALGAQLERNFEDVCGDTFCEGDYSNLTPLRLRCSVVQGSGRIGQCVWVFAGSYEDIAPGSGAVEVWTQHWECALPLAPNTRIDALMAALAGDSPLFTTLPGTGVSIYDGLGDCL